MEILVMQLREPGFKKSVKTLTIQVWLRYGIDNNEIDLVVETP